MFIISEVHSHKHADPRETRIIALCLYPDQIQQIVDQYVENTYGDDYAEAITINTNKFNYDYDTHFCEVYRAPLTIDTNILVWALNAATMLREVMPSLPAFLENVTGIDARHFAAHVMTTLSVLYGVAMPVDARAHMIKTMRDAVDDYRTSAS